MTLACGYHYTTNTVVISDNHPHDNFVNSSTANASFITVLHLMLCAQTLT